MRWRYRLGGKLEPSEAVICAAGGDLSEDLLVVSPTGRLAAYRFDGSVVWEQRTIGSFTLHGCADLAGDGHPRVVAGSSGLSGGQLRIFDAATGRALWVSDPGPGSVGAVKLGPAGPFGRTLYWLPAASATLTAFSMIPGRDTPAPLWATDLQSFVSDPYTYSSLALDGPPGSRRIIVSGARGAVPTIVVDAPTGREITRAQFYAAANDHGYESGGQGQLLQLADVDGSAAGPQIVTVSNYGSGDTYMFQGVTIAHPLRPQDDRSLDTYPVGLRYVQGSLQAFDGGSRKEILVSRFNPAAGRHDLVLLDGATLLAKSTVEDVYLAGIVEDAGEPLILGLAESDSENALDREGRLVSYRYRSGAFVRAGFEVSAGSLAAVTTRDLDNVGGDNTGTAVVTLTRSGAHGVLVMRDRDRDGKKDTLVLADVASGSALATFEAPSGVGLDILAVRAPGDEARQRLVVAGDDGSLLFLDGDLHVVETIPVGGFYRNPALNGHAFEVAAVGPMLQAGRNDVVVVDSLNRILRLTDVDRADRETGPSAVVLSQNGVQQELLLVPGQSLNRIAVRAATASGAALRLLDGGGHVAWEHAFAGDGLGPTTLPIGWNVGRFGSGAGGDVVVSVGTPDKYPTRMCALDGSSGAKLWCSTMGAFWDAAPAIWDFNRDGYDDLTLNFNNSKSILLDGRTGQEWGRPVVLPQWEHLGWVDYNGAPSVAGVDPSGAVRIVNSGDDAHLALLHADVTKGTAAAAITQVWAVPQSRPDDQRYSMAAIAPAGAQSSDWVVGVGGQTGLLEGRRGSDGTLLWQRRLWNGGFVSGVENNPLSSILAVDVNGDSRVEFVVGGADGWLYAVSAATGALVWSLDLGTSLGEPIAADFQNEGSSSLLVPAADGYLYAIGPPR
ncbi:MAG: PQQ-binding-like beta-propeller repeat protein [Acidobacteriota bacterium]